MLSIDFKNAIEDPTINNFTVLLIRLLLKADIDNFVKLQTIYPVEACMVDLFKTNCSYIDNNKNDVDYRLLEIRAQAIVKSQCYSQKHLKLRKDIKSWPEE